MKTLITLLFFVATVAPAVAEVAGNEPNPAKTECQLLVPGNDPILEFDLESGILFQETVYIHIEDGAGRQLVNGAFTRSEISKNEALNQLLRKSTRYLTLDNHYYYYAEK